MTISATGTVVSSVDPDAQAFFTATGITDTTQKNAINTLVTSLKSAGIWTKMTAVYPFVGGTAARHAVNLKTPGTFNITWSGSVTHNANGVTVDGTTGYGNTGVIPASHLSEGSAHMGVYTRNITNRDQIEIGSLSQTVSPYVSFYLITNFVASPNVRGDCWNALDQTVSSASSLNRLFVISRTSVNSLKLYNNNTLLNTNTTSVSGSGAFALNTRSIFICARNTNGSATQFSNTNIAFASIGQGLTDSEVTAFTNAVNTFQTALSRNV